MASASELYDEAIKMQESGETEAAIGKLESILADDPDCMLAHAGLSAFCSQLEQHEKAVEHAEKVCELDPGDPFSYIAMSMICQKAGKLPEAELAMKQAMEKQWTAGRNEGG